MSLCDHVWVLAEGQNLADGTPAEIGKIEVYQISFARCVVCALAKTGQTTNPPLNLAAIR